MLKNIKFLIFNICCYAFFLGVITLTGMFLLYQKIDSGNYYNLDKNDENIFFGHSHTACAIDDAIIKKSINLSNSGEGMYYTYFKVKKILENNKVKNIFISFTNNYIEKNCDSLEIFKKNNIKRWGAKYFAYMEENDWLVLLKNRPKTLLMSQSLSIRKYISFLLSKDKSIIENLSWGKRDKVEKCKVDSILKLKITKENIPKFEYSVFELIYFDKIVKLCKKHNTNIVFIRCPVHSTWINATSEFYFQKLLKNRFKTVTFLDFKNFPIKNKEFADLHHLNIFGAEKFSIFLNKLLQNNILSKTDKQKIINQEMIKVK